MLTRAIILILFSFYITIAYDTANENFNVGTVLFSPSDTDKKSWSATEIGLLKARQYFQELIPSPTFLNTLSDDHVDKLLDYFRDAYSSIRKASPDPETDDILTTAFSDAIGGYLKFWVLPITKFAFYGGTVSQRNALKLFDFRDWILNYMDTDGEGWRKPDVNLLQSTAINVAPKAHYRSTSGSCDELAYFENTTTGLSIPIPYVNWGEDTNTMFVPLKRESLVSLKYPNSSKTLLKFYDTAKNCANSIEDQNNFDTRFQVWLTKDVIPHLTDDELYLALENVLTLINKSRNVYHPAVNPCDEFYIQANKKLANKIAGVPIDFSSKKLIFIGIIIFLEMTWCIPALIYMTCKKHKNKQRSEIYLVVDTEKKQHRKGKSFMSLCKNSEAASKETLIRDKSMKRGKPKSKFVQCSNMSINEIPRAISSYKRHLPRHRDVEAQVFTSISKNSIGMSTQSVFNSPDYAVEAEDENPMETYQHKLKTITTASGSDPVLNNCISNKTCMVFIGSQELDSDKFDSATNERINKYISSKKSKEYIDNPELDPGRIELSIKEQNNDSYKRKMEFTDRQELDLAQIESKPIKTRMQSCVSIKRSVEFVDNEVLGPVKIHSEIKGHIEINDNDIIEYINQAKKAESSKTTLIDEINKSDRVSCICDSEILKDEASKTELTKKKSQNKISKWKRLSKDKCCNIMALKLKADTPYLEITFDRPQNEVCVDINQLINKSFLKPSKIPRRSTISNQVQTPYYTTRNTQVSSRSNVNRKSFIPQLKTRATDDIYLNQNKPDSEGDGHLNYSL